MIFKVDYEYMIGMVNSTKTIFFDCSSFQEVEILFSSYNDKNHSLCFENSNKELVKLMPSGWIKSITRLGNIEK